MEPASKANIADHAEAWCGPPVRSSMMPAPHAPSADKPNPTVVYIAMVAPLCDAAELMAMPDVSAPESAGTVRAWISSSASKRSGRGSDRKRDGGRSSHHNHERAVSP